MRSMKRLRNTDFKKIQKSVKQKVDKDAQTMIQLIDLPDFDVSEFFQTLLKSPSYEQVLDKIPIEKKIDFFSKNYITFLQTQDQLLQLKLPNLPQIPKSKQYHLTLKTSEKPQENQQQASIIQIIDSFSTHVLQKNTEQVLRIYSIIQQMKKHPKYRDYFEVYSINKIFRQAYIQFVQNCSEEQILLKIGQHMAAMRLHLKNKGNLIFQKIRIDLRIDSSNASLKKAMKFLLNEIEEEIKQFKIKFDQQLKQSNQPSIYISKWISDLTRTYYQIIQGYIYEQQEIYDILKSLGIILQASTQNQSKGISLARELKKLIATDLPLHLQKIIEVVLDSFDDIQKYNNELYQFVQFRTLNCINDQLKNLKPIRQNQYGKKICSQKGIVLINSFLMILLPLCDQKWSFLHQNIIETLVDKVRSIIEKTKLSHWDYYHMFYFFYQLSQGKIRHKLLFDINNCLYLKEKIVIIQKTWRECKNVFENKIILLFWTQVLQQIPKQLWDFKKYAETLEKPNLKPTTFSISVIFAFQQFFKQLQYRLSKQHFESFTLQFFEYFIYVLEYLLYWSYHDKGKNEKVFTLNTKSKTLFQKSKQFSVDELEFVKLGKILKISHFTKNGLQRFAIDMYFIQEVSKIIGKSEKINVQGFVDKLSKILAKETKSQPLNVSKQQYIQFLKKFVNVYLKQPQVIKNYLNEKRGGSSGSSKISLSSKESLKE